MDRGFKVPVVPASSNAKGKGKARDEPLESEQGMSRFHALCPVLTDASRRVEDRMWVDLYEPETEVSYPHPELRVSSLFDNHLMVDDRPT